jgi:integrase
MLPLVISGNKMKKHLTAVSVEKIRPPKEGSLEVFDLGYPGLALRVGHGGAKTFEHFYRVGGKLKRETLGRWPAISLADARMAWRKTREAIAKGEAPSQGAKAPLFETVVEDWLKRDQSQNKASSFYQATRSVEAELLPAWRGKPVDRISKSDVLAVLDGIIDRGAPVMARRAQAHINRFFSWCIERDILKSDPTAGMPRVGNVKSRDRVLCDAEWAKIWSAAIGPYGAATRLLLLTGARREEISQLRWSEIDGDCIRLEATRTKTGVPHDIYQLLAGMPRIGEFVFTSTGKGPIQAWSQAKAKLDAESGVTGWRIHDLRRTVATGMQKLGITLQVVEAVLGHTSGSRAGVVGIYQRHDYAEEKRAALEAWGAHVTELVDGGTS